MNNVPIPANNAQVRATRIGYLTTFFVLLCVCLCAVSVWIVFASDSLAILKTSLYLQSNGTRINGTIVDVETISHLSATSSPTEKIIIEYAIDGVSHTIKSRFSYHVGDYALGDSIDVLYDPNDPDTVQLDIFNERWLMPILESLPF